MKTETFHNAQHRYENLEPEEDPFSRSAWQDHLAGLSDDDLFVIYLNWGNDSDIIPFPNLTDLLTELTERKLI